MGIWLNSWYYWSRTDMYGWWFCRVLKPSFIGFETISHEDVIQKSLVDGWLINAHELMVVSHDFWMWFVYKNRGFDHQKKRCITYTMYICIYIYTYFSWGSTNRGYEREMMVVWVRDFFVSALLGMTIMGWNMKSGDRTMLHHFVKTGWWFLHASGVHLWKYFLRTFNMMLGIGSESFGASRVSPSKKRKIGFLVGFGQKALFFCSCSLSFFLRWLNIWKTHLRMPVCALVNEKIFCVHGGISPELKNLDQIRQLERRGRLSMDGSGKAVKKCWISHCRYIILHILTSCYILPIFEYLCSSDEYIYIIIYI